MKLRSVVGTAIGVLCQLAAIPVASADPVTITSGFAVINLTRLPRGSVELQGTGGFTFVGD